MSKPLALLLSLLLFSACRAQTCEPFAGSPSVCSGLIGYPVWLPPGTTQAELARQFVSSGALASSLLPGECARASAVSICSQFFRACGTDGSPLPLCGDFCDLGASVCGPAGAQTFNCTAAMDFARPGERLWQWFTNGTAFPDSCAVANASTPVIDCPTPFIPNGATDQCTIKCPPTGLDDESVNDKTIKIAIVGGSLSIFCALALLPYLAWVASTRKNTNYMFNVWLTILISAIGDVVPKWLSVHEIMCSDPYTLRRRDSTSCLFTSFTGIWSRQATAYWTMFAMYRVFEILYRVDWTKRLKPEHTKIVWLTENFVFSLVGWGFPTIQYVIAVAGDWISTSGPYSCGVDSTPYGGWVNNGLTLLPLTVVETITTFFIVVIVYKIWRTGWNVVREHWNTVMLCCIYAFVVWYIVIFAWDTFRIRDRITEHIVDFIQCSAVTGGAPGVCRYDSAISINWQLSVVAFTSFYPVPMFAVIFPRGPMQFYRNVITTRSLGSSSPFSSDVNSSRMSTTGGPGL